MSGTRAALPRATLLQEHLPQTRDHIRHQVGLLGLGREQNRSARLSTIIDASSPKSVSPRSRCCCTSWLMLQCKQSDISRPFTFKRVSFAAADRLRRAEPLKALPKSRSR